MLQRLALDKPMDCHDEHQDVSAHRQGTHMEHMLKWDAVIVHARGHEHDAEGTKVREGMKDDTDTQNKQILDVHKDADRLGIDDEVRRS